MYESHWLVSISFVRKSFIPHPQKCHSGVKITDTDGVINTQFCELNEASRGFSAVSKAKPLKLLLLKATGELAAKKIKKK